MYRSFQSLGSEQLYFQIQWNDRNWSVVVKLLTVFTKGTPRDPNMACKFSVHGGVCADGATGIVEPLRLFVPLACCQRSLLLSYFSFYILAMLRFCVCFVFLPKFCTSQAGLAAVHRSYLWCAQCAERVKRTNKYPRTLWTSVLCTNLTSLALMPSATNTSNRPLVMKKQWSQVGTCRNTRRTIQQNI